MGEGGTYALKCSQLIGVCTNVRDVADAFVVEYGVTRVVDIGNPNAVYEVDAVRGAVALRYSPPGKTAVFLVGNVYGRVRFDRVWHRLQWLPQDVETGAEATRRLTGRAPLLWDVVAPEVCPPPAVKRGRRDDPRVEHLRTLGATFWHREDAMGRAQMTGMAVVGVQLDYTGMRMFVVVHPSQVLRVMVTAPFMVYSNFTMQPGPAMLYFDLDAKFAERPEMRDEEAQKAEVWGVIDTTIRVLGELGFAARREDFLIFKTPRDHKMSYHVYATGFYFESYAIMWSLARMVVGEMGATTTVDAAPYCALAQQFRAGSKLVEDEAPLVPAPVPWHTATIHGTGKKWPWCMVAPQPVPLRARVVALHLLGGPRRDALVEGIGVSGRRGKVVGTPVRSRPARHGEADRKKFTLPAELDEPYFRELAEKGVSFVVLTETTTHGTFTKLRITDGVRDNTLVCERCGGITHRTPGSMWAYIRKLDDGTWWEKWYCNSEKNRFKKKRG